MPRRGGWTRARACVCRGQRTTPCSTDRARAARRVQPRCGAGRRRCHPCRALGRRALCASNGQPRRCMPERVAHAHEPTNGTRGRERRAATSVLADGPKRRCSPCRRWAWRRWAGRYSAGRCWAWRCWAQPGMDAGRCCGGGVHGCERRRRTGGQRPRNRAWMPVASGLPPTRSRPLTSHSVRPRACTTDVQRQVSVRVHQYLDAA